MHKNEDGTEDEESDEVCLKQIREAISEAKEDYREVEKVLRAYYDGVES